MLRVFRPKSPASTRTATTFLIIWEFLIAAGKSDPDTLTRRYFNVVDQWISFHQYSSIYNKNNAFRRFITGRITTINDDDDDEEEEEEEEEEEKEEEEEEGVQIKSLLFVNNNSTTTGNQHQRQHQPIFEKIESSWHDMAVDLIAYAISVSSSSSTRRHTSNILTDPFYPSKMLQILVLQHGKTDEAIECLEKALSTGQVQKICTPDTTIILEQKQQQQQQQRQGQSKRPRRNTPTEGSSETPASCSSATTTTTITTTTTTTTTTPTVKGRGGVLRDSVCVCIYYMSV